MEFYQLKPHEVVLFKGTVQLINKKEPSELILTNLNLVFITKEKKLFAEGDTFVEYLPMQEVKFYKNVPQIKNIGVNVEVYFISGEKFFSFETKGEAHKFCIQAINLVTDTTRFQRALGKVKGTIGVVDETFDCDIVGSTKTLIKTELQGGVKSLAGKALGAVGKKLVTKFGKEKQLPPAPSVTKDEKKSVNL